MKSSWLIFLISCSLLINCQSKKTNKQIKIINTVPDSFEMYKTSEMANLMRTMFAKNEMLRKQIINGDSIGEFNQEYLKIHTATLTDSTDLDGTYPAFANHFLKMQKAIFKVSQNKQKEQFNNMVNSCIACHKDRCTGPIPRIEKLRID